MAEVCIIIPACNEAEAITETIQEVERAFLDSGHDWEVVVVDDCSQDETTALACQTVARVIRHPTNKGYGNALLTGTRNTTCPWIAIADADGTYPVEELPAMLDGAIARDLDMAVAARQGRHYRENPVKRCARYWFKFLSEWVTGETIPDINSGMRVIRRDLITAFAPVLSGGFSFTTSITIIAFQTGHHVAYYPCDYRPRKGKSKVRYVRDTLRALQIIVLTIVLFNPIKLYLLEAFAVCCFTVSASVLVALVPGAAMAVLLGSIGFFTASIILAIGFWVVRQQINVSGFRLPQRGYQPSAPAVVEVD